MRVLLFSNCHGHTTEILKRELIEQGHAATTFTSTKTAVNVYKYNYDAYCNRLNPFYPFYILYMILKYDVFVFYGAIGFLPTWRHPLIDRLFLFFLPVIKSLKKKIVYIPIGSDVRIREIHMKYVGTDTYMPVRSEKEMKSIRRGIHTIFSYADAIISLDAEMRLNLDEWNQRFKNKFSEKIHDTFLPIELPKKLKKPRNSRLRFLHAPTKRELKGTQHIVSAVNRLKKEGYKFDFVLLEKVPQKTLFAEIEKSDLVIDQVKEGSVGALARESMAFEKPVIAHFVSTFDKELGDILINATPDTIYSVLRDVLEGKYNLRRLGRSGRLYIKKKHDPKSFANEILSLVT